MDQKVPGTIDTSDAYLYLLPGMLHEVRLCLEETLCGRQCVHLQPTGQQPPDKASGRQLNPIPNHTATFVWNLLITQRRDTLLYT